MKRLFSILILFAICPFTALSDRLPHEDNLMRPSPVTTFHEIWAIPWDTAYEEFIEFTFQYKDITFRIGTERQEDFSAITEEDVALTYLDIPVKRMSCLFSRSSRLLSNLDFEFYIDEELTVLEKLAIFRDLYNQLAAQYGQPSYAFLSFLQLEVDDKNHILSTESFYFNLPMNGLKVDISELLKLYEDDHNLYIHVLFDNLSLSVIAAKFVRTQQFEVSLSAASARGIDFPSFLPPITILPYEQFAIFPSYRP